MLNVSVSCFPTYFLILHLCVCMTFQIWLLWWSFKSLHGILRLLSQKDLQYLWLLNCYWNLNIISNAIKVQPWKAADGSSVVRTWQAWLRGWHRLTWSSLLRCSKAKHELSEEFPCVWWLQMRAGWKFNGAAIPQTPLEAFQCQIRFKCSGHLHKRQTIQHIK